MEWNQPYPQQSLKQNNGTLLHGEIIQIGAVKLNSDFSYADKFEINVKPTAYKKINKRVAEMTKIDTKTAENGLEAEYALSSFFEWCGDGFSFVTWGNDDIRVLHENLNYLGLSLSFIPKQNYDLQVAFDYITQKKGRQYSLDYAMEFYGIEETLPRHNAFSDAYYTALVCMELKPHGCFANYRTAETERLSFCDESDYEEFVKDVELVDGTDTVFAFKKMSEEKVLCPSCEKRAELVKKYKQSDLKFALMYKCTVHGRFMSMLRFRSFDNLNVIRAVRNTYRPGIAANKNMKEKAVKWRAV